MGNSENPQNTTSSSEVHSDLHYLIAEIDKSKINESDITDEERRESLHLVNAMTEKNIPKILVTKLKNKNATVTEIPEEEIIGNPIGMLQELCMIRKWMPPEYGTEQEEGLPHERLFTISCVVGDFREYGVGKSKKLAKRQAAHKMVQKILTIPAEDDKINFDEDDEIIDRFASQKSARGSNYGNASRKISQFHRNLKGLSGSKLDMLKKMNLDKITLDPIRLVRDIAAENKIEITYVSIDEKSHSGKFQRLIQLSTLPVSVCHGSGNTLEEAQRDAAMRALHYIKLLTSDEWML